MIDRDRKKRRLCALEFTGFDVLRRDDLGVVNAAEVWTIVDPAMALATANGSPAGPSRLPSYAATILLASVPRPPSWAWCSRSADVPPGPKMPARKPC